MDADRVILIGLGANLPSSAGTPPQTLDAALERLRERGIDTSLRSRIWRTPPMPPSDQPWFVNAVVAAQTALEPTALLECLHAVESAFGRWRGAVNAARTLDLDLLAYGRRIMTGPAAPLLPHPRMAMRAFVLLPLRDILPGWRHPVSGAGVAEMLATLPAEDVAAAEVMSEGRRGDETFK